MVERQADFYMNLIDKESSVYKTIADEIKEIGTDNSVKKVLDIGCGKGGISKT